jgi:hypothetical protein
MIETTIPHVKTWRRPSCPPDEPTPADIFGQLRRNGSTSKGRQNPTPKKEAALRLFYVGASFADALTNRGRHLVECE